eukprot:TRINITY_DN685_c0_g3_i2.p1 TRINITY_DN685_c0_g3~~TRINITY_DN685_c0_g3_i2.p1  ORF type:complete len:1220 (+),score=545.58 TRINITY_DN685_c0_g3_i2:110-3769(+)
MDKKKKRGPYQDLDRKRRTLLRRFREAEKKRSERMNASLKKAVEKEAKTRKRINASPLRRSPSPKKPRGEESEKLLAFSREDNIREQRRILQGLEELWGTLHASAAEIVVAKNRLEELEGTEEGVDFAQFLLDAWSDHKERTIAVLLCIRKRENALSALRSIAMRTDPSQQASALSTLYTYAQQLQALTIEVVNRIDQWREPLSLPYPFLWKGSNYLLKCAKDCLTLKEDGLSKLLKGLICDESNPAFRELNVVKLRCEKQLGAELPLGAPSAYVHQAEMIILSEERTQKRLQKKLETGKASGKVYFVLGFLDDDARDGIVRVGATPEPSSPQKEDDSTEEENRDEPAPSPSRGEETSTPQSLKEKHCETKEEEPKENAHESKKKESEKEEERKPQEAKEDKDHTHVGSGGHGQEKKESSPRKESLPREESLDDIEEEEEKEEEIDVGGEDDASASEKMEESEEVREPPSPSSDFDRKAEEVEEAKLETTDHDMKQKKKDSREEKDTSIPVTHHEREPEDSSTHLAKGREKKQGEEEKTEKEVDQPEEEKDSMTVSGQCDEERCDPEATLDDEYKDDDFEETDVQHVTGEEEASKNVNRELDDEYKDDDFEDADGDDAPNEDKKRDMGTEKDGKEKTEMTDMEEEKELHASKETEHADIRDGKEDTELEPHVAQKDAKKRDIVEDVYNDDDFEDAEVQDVEDEKSTHSAIVEHTDKEDEETHRTKEEGASTDVRPDDVDEHQNGDEDATVGETKDVKETQDMTEKIHEDREKEEKEGPIASKEETSTLSLSRDHKDEHRDDDFEDDPDARSHKGTGHDHSSAIESDQKLFEPENEVQEDEDFEVHHTSEEHDHAIADSEVHRDNDAVDDAVDDIDGSGQIEQGKEDHGSVHVGGGSTKKDEVSFISEREASDLHKNVSAAEVQGDQDSQRDFTNDEKDVSEEKEEDSTHVDEAASIQKDEEEDPEDDVRQGDDSSPPLDANGSVPKPSHATARDDLSFSGDVLDAYVLDSLDEDIAADTSTEDAAVPVKFTDDSDIFGQSYSSIPTGHKDDAKDTDADADRYADTNDLSADDTALDGLDDEDDDTEQMRKDQMSSPLTTSGLGGSRPPTREIHFVGDEDDDKDEVEDDGLFDTLDDLDDVVDPQDDMAASPPPASKTKESKTASAEPIASHSQQWDSVDINTGDLMVSDEDEDEDALLESLDDPFATLDEDVDHLVDAV